METRVVRLVADLRSMLGDYLDPPAFAADAEGALHFAARHKKQKAPADLLVLRWHEGQTRSFTLQGEPMSVSHVQPIGDGVLLVGARCAYKSGAAERNALVLDWSGELRDRFTLGDGINHLRVGPDGTIWCGYFDEGVFGNHGWGMEGPQPMGAPGLVGYSAHGERTFAFDAERAGTEGIADVYAMNLAHDGALWLYFYDSFPLVQVRNGEYRAWKLGASGAHAFAVDGRRALLFGDYSSNNRDDVARLVKLRDDGTAQVTGDFKLIGPEGEPMDDVVAAGVGPVLYLFNWGRVFALDAW
ncbi:MAG: hypothetical protein JST92_11030 [Deltaproteobacteria bacterium]|nr:hypothetical protein [Deltaproteobacteria bacterium]